MQLPSIGIAPLFVLIHAVLNQTSLAIFRAYPSITPFFMMKCSNAVTVSWTYYYCLEHKQPISFEKPRHFMWVILRCICGALSMICLTYAARMIPLSELSPICFSNPILTGILSYFVFHTEYTLKHFISTLICLCGVIFIVKPPFFLRWIIDGDIESKEGSLLGYTLGVMSLILFGTSNVLTKYIAPIAKGTQQALYIGLCQAVMLGLLCTLDPPHFTEIPISAIPAIILYSVISASTYFFYNIAYERGDPTTLSILGYSNILFAYFIDLFVFHTGIDSWNVTGSLMIVISCVYIVTLPKRKRSITKKSIKNKTDSP